MLYSASRSEPARHRGTVLDVSRRAMCVFAPSDALLHAYKANRIKWREFARRYRDGLRALWRADPQVFLDLAHQASVGDVTLVSWERGDERTIRSHRRVLREVVDQVARVYGLVVDPEIDFFDEAVIVQNARAAGRLAPEREPEPGHLVNRKWPR